MESSLAEKRKCAIHQALGKVRDKHNSTPEERLAGNALTAAWKLWHHVKPDLEECSEKERHGWDIWLSSMRAVGQGLKQAFALKLLGSVFGCGELVDKITVYGERSLELSKAGLLIHRQETKYNKLVNENPDSLKELYASFRTWEKDEQLDKYLDNIAEYDRLKLELIIEGPIQLALSLSDTAITAILRLPLWLGNRDEPEVQDLKLVGKAIINRLNKDWESGWLSILHGMAEEVLEEYHISYGKQLRCFRVLIPAEDGRKRFISAYEAGQYRSTTDAYAERDTGVASFRATETR